MEIYVLLFNFIIVMYIALSNKNNKKQTKLFCNIILVLLILIQGLRSIDIGEDSIVYVEWFQRYIFLRDTKTIKEILLLNDGVDIGYKFLNIFISFFTSNYHVLFFIVSFLIIILIIKFIQYNVENAFLGILIFLGINFFITSMVSWRQFIAIGFVIWQLHFYLKKKYYLVLLFAILGFLFHDTSIIFSITLLFSFILAKYKINPIIILLLGIFVILFKEIFAKIVLIILPDLSFYNLFDGKIKIGKMRMLMNFIEFVIVIYVYKYLKNEKNLMSVYMLCFSIILGILSLFVPYMFRLNYYFDFFLIILIPEIAYYNKEKKWFFISIVSSCYVFYIYYLSNNPGNTVPYKFFF